MSSCILSVQQLTGDLIDQTPICLTPEPVHRLSHHQAQLLWSCGAQFCDDAPQGRFNLLLSKLLREVLFQNDQLSLFLSHEIFSVALLEHLNRLFPLLDLAPEDVDDFLFGRLAQEGLFSVQNGRSGHPDGIAADNVLLAHRRFEIRHQPFLDRHATLLRRTRPVFREKSL